MKIGKTLFLLLALTIFALTKMAMGQQPAQPQNAHPPAVAQPNAEQKARITELAKQWDTAVKAADAARDKYMIQLLATLAELGLKPSETSISWNEKGEPVFSRIEPTKAPAQPTTKTEAKP